jgi:GT2 family glycosyltransferase
MRTVTLARNRKLAASSDSDVSVVICCYTDERWEDLLAAVESVRRQTATPRDTVVVVDHNPTLFRLVCDAMPDVLTIMSEGVCGLAGARNSGVAATRGSVVAFLDDDAVAAPDWLERLMEGYQNERVLGVGGLIEPAWPGDPPRWFPEEFAWVVGCSYRGLPRGGGPVRNLIGANMSIRREVFAAVGGFESSLGHVGNRPGGDEETELCIRARQRWPSGIFLYEPTARVRHRVSPARLSWQYFRSRCWAEGRAKARVSRLVGASAGLSSEWKYTLGTLPTGFALGIRDAVLGHEPAGLARAGAIAGGLSITTAGYLRGVIARGD